MAELVAAVAGSIATAPAAVPMRATMPSPMSRPSGPTASARAWGVRAKAVDTARANTAFDTIIAARVEAVGAKDDDDYVDNEEDREDGEDEGREDEDPNA